MYTVQTYKLLLLMIEEVAALLLIFVMESHIGCGGNAESEATYYLVVNNKCRKLFLMKQRRSKYQRRRDKGRHWTNKMKENCVSISKKNVVDFFLLLSTTTTMLQ